MHSGQWISLDVLRPCSAYELHFILAKDCQASQFKLTEMAIQFAKNTLRVSQDPSLLLSYHTFIKLLQSSYWFYQLPDSHFKTILPKWLCSFHIFSLFIDWPSSLLAFPNLFLQMTPNPLRAPEWAAPCPSSESLWLFHLKAATTKSYSMESPSLVIPLGHIWALW